MNTQVEEIKKLIKQGLKLELISLEMDIPIEQLEQWKKEVDEENNISQNYPTRKMIKRKEREARLLAEPDNIRNLCILVSMARGNGQTEKEKKLLERILELDPNNIGAIGSLIRIVREEGDIETEKKLLEKILEIDPNNIKARMSLIRIAREEGETDAEKKVLKRILEIDSNNVKAMSSLIRIALEEGRLQKARELQERLLELQPNNRRGKKTLRWIIGVQEKIKEKASKNSGEVDAKVELSAEESEELFRLTSTTQKELTPTEQARKIIYGSEKILEDLEAIATIIEQEDDETIRILIQAEAAIKAKLNQRAETILKRYKKSSQSQGDLSAVNIANKAIALSKNTKICDPLKWEALYKAYAEMRKKEQISTDDSEGR